MGDKRGLTLLETVLDIIIAIIVIIILFYAISAILGIFFGGKQELQAEGQLENIMKSVNAAKLSDGKFGFLLQNPAGWRLVSFVNGENAEVEKSLLCGASNCICLCPDPLLSKPNCQKGQCKILDLPIYFNGVAANVEIQIKNMCLQKIDDYYSLTEEKCDIPLST